MKIPKEKILPVRNSPQWLLSIMNLGLVIFFSWLSGEVIYQLTFKNFPFGTNEVKILFATTLSMVKYPIFITLFLQGARKIPALHAGVYENLFFQLFTPGKYKEKRKSWIYIEVQSGYFFAIPYIHRLVTDEWINMKVEAYVLKEGFSVQTKDGTPYGFDGLIRGAPKLGYLLNFLRHGNEAAPSYTVVGSKILGILQLFLSVEVAKINDVDIKAKLDDLDDEFRKRMSEEEAKEQLAELFGFDVIDIDLRDLIPQGITERVEAATRRIKILLESIRPFENEFDKDMLLLLVARMAGLPQDEISALIALTGMRGRQ